MEQDVFNIIEEYYMNKDIAEVTTTAEEEAFYRELINPVSERNPEAGREFEDKFLSAAVAVQKQSFRNGFKSGIHFLLECMSGE